LSGDISKKKTASDCLPDMKNIFLEQKNALDSFFEKLDFNEVAALAQKILSIRGTVLFTGVGKSGFIAKKINQTLVSTGTKALWLAPVDALHGDIGLVDKGDILIMFSKSGTTKELLTLVPYAKAKGAFIVALTSKPESRLAKVSDMHVTLPLSIELQAFGDRYSSQVDLVSMESRETPPATSNTIQMLFGDTLAVALMNARGLTQNQYAMNHPAGRIGKRLVMRVENVMQSGSSLAQCTQSENGLQVLQSMSTKPHAGGCILVTDDDGHLLGTLQDGDLRRALTKHGKAVLDMSVKDLMNFAKQFPNTCSKDMMAADAVIMMDKNHITYIPVISEQNILEGMVTFSDLAAAGL